MRSGAARRLGLVFYFVLLAAYALWPLPLHLSDRLLRAEEADPYLNVAGFAQFAQNLSGAHPLWYGRGFAPEERTLAYTDPFAGLALAAAPVSLAARNPVLGYNVVLLLSAILSGLAAHRLARESAGPAGALFAASAFVLAPIRVAHLRHIQLYATFLLPLLLCVALRLRREGPGRFGAIAIALGAGLVLQGFFSFYLFAFALPILAIVLLAPGAKGSGRLAAGAAAAGAILLVGAVYLPIAKIQRELGLAFDARESVFWSARLGAFLEPPYETLAGKILTAPGRWDREHQRYLGAAFLLACAAGLAARWPGAPWRGGRPLPLRAGVLCGGGLLLSGGLALPALPSLTASGAPWSNPAALAFLTLAIAVPAGMAIAALRPGPLGRAALAAWILSLGPLVLAGPIARAAWAFGPYTILQVLPGFASLRVPSRFAFWMLAALLPLAARGFDRLPPAARVALAALLFAETWTGPHLATAVETPARPSRVVHAARALPAGALLAEAPCPDEAAQARAVYRATLHRRSVVNGFSSLWTPRNEIARAATRVDPRAAPDSAAALARLGVEWVLLPDGSAHKLEPRP